jgi:phage tail-like protein
MSALTTTAPPELEQTGPLTVSHIPDAYRRYPGETVHFFTRVVVQRTIPGFTLRIAIPIGLTLVNYNPILDHPGLLPTIENQPDRVVLIWEAEGEIAAGTVLEYQTETIVDLTRTDLSLTSSAVLIVGSGEAVSFRTREPISIQVRAKGQYLRYLPAVYDRDEFMGRFLMLFESFWKPIDGQLEMLPFYFDPRLTPSDLLPWLAAWLNLVLDERWPERKRRELLRSAIILYRKRGTKLGLQKYLEIYTGVEPQIIEYRANNFALGPEARLGFGIALGTANQPHTFKVVLQLPEAASPDDETTRRQIVEAIIEAEKPAHTAYVLEIETHTAVEHSHGGDEGRQL